MMKSEFEELVGVSVDWNTYKRIEAVYVECDFFQNKQQLVNFYKHYDMNGIERMYTGVVLSKRKDEETIRNLRKESDELKKKFDDILGGIRDIIGTASNKEDVQ